MWQIWAPAINSNPLIFQLSRPFVQIPERSPFPPNQFVQIPPNQNGVKYDSVGYIMHVNSDHIQMFPIRLRTDERDRKY